MSRGFCNTHGTIGVEIRAAEQETGFSGVCEMGDRCRYDVPAPDSNNIIVQAVVTVKYSIKYKVYIYANRLHHESMRVSEWAKMIVGAELGNTVYVNNNYRKSFYFFHSILTHRYSLTTYPLCSSVYPMPLPGPG